MSAVHLVLGAGVLLVNLVAGLLGAWRWWRVETSDAFWWLARAGQVAVVLQILLGGALIALGEDEPAELHILYGLLPIGVIFVAEQFRVGSAQAVLDARGLPNAEAVGKLAEVEQRTIVLSIVRREVGVTALSALIVAALALRAGGVSGGWW